MNDAELEPIDARQQRVEQFAGALRTGRENGLLEERLRKLIEAMGQKQTLDEEIGALRLALRQVIAVDLPEGDSTKTSATIARLTNAIVRAVRTQRLIDGSAVDSLSEAISRVLNEMGMGDD